MQSQGSIEIHQNIELVFRLTNDHVPDWSRIVVSEELIDEVPGVVGSRFRTVTEDRGRRMIFDGTITQYKPPNHSMVSLIGQHFDIVAAYDFEDLDGRTRVTQISNVKGKGFGRVLLFLFGWVMRKSHCDATQRELESLRAFCEAADVS